MKNTLNLKEELIRLWQEKKENMDNMRKELVNELTKQISEQIISAFQELEVSDETKTIHVFAIPYKKESTKSTQLNIKFIFQEEKSGKLVKASDCEKILNLSKPIFRICGAQACNINPKDRVFIEPFWVYLSENSKNHIDITKEVIIPLLSSINPLVL